MNLKRIFIVAGVAAMMVGMPAMQKVLARAPEGKVRICHFTKRGAGKGIVIEVSRHAVPAHIRLHGDCLDFETSSHHGHLCRCIESGRHGDHGNDSNSGDQGNNGENGDKGNNGKNGDNGNNGKNGGKGNNGKN